LTSFLPLQSSYRDKFWLLFEKNSKKQDLGVSTIKVTQGSKILAFQQEKSSKKVERFGQPNCFSSFLILVYNAMSFFFSRHISLTEKKNQQFDILYFLMQFTVYTDYTNLI
jgi:hypothetical protein